MRLAAILAASLTATACASWDKTERVVTEIGRVPVEEAMGLTRAEVEARLGLKTGDVRYMTSVALEDGAQVETVHTRVLTRYTRCPDNAMPEINWRRAADRWSAPPLVFRDDKLAGFIEWRRQNEDLSQPVFLTATCTAVHRAGKDVAQDTFLVALSLPLMLPVAGAAAIVAGASLAGANDINGPLAQLSLGAPPPGGLEAYLGKLPPGATLISREGNNAAIAFHWKTPDNARDPRFLAAATATFENGVVVRLEGRACRMTPTRAVQCERE